MKRLLAVSFAVSTLVFCTAAVRAQSSAARGAAATRQAPLSQSLSGAAKESFDSAQVLLNNGDSSGALAKFAQAYEISKDPRLLFNMAVCGRNLHDYARMQSLLIRYEREAALSMSAKDKADVDGALATIRNLVGAVKVSVSEPAASVAVDGDRVGTSPIEDPIALNLGKHTLSVKKTGFEPVERTLDVAGGSETTLAVTLVVKRQVGRLIVVSDEGATVVVDGRSAAKGRLDEQFEAGPHQVQVTEPARLPFKAQVDLHDGETRSLDVTLEPEKESHGGRVWPWVVGGAAVAVGASIGAYFLFRPQDETLSVPSGRSGTLQLQDWRR